MKTSPLERKKKIEKVRKERIIFFNKANNLGSNDANVYVIVEYNGKYFIYNSCSDKEWSPLDVMLVNNIIFVLFSAKDILIARRRDIIRFRNDVFRTIFVEE